MNKSSAFYNKTPKQDNTFIIFYRFLSSKTTFGRNYKTPPNALRLSFIKNEYYRIV